jgi:hypothetical protein
MRVFYTSQPGEAQASRAMLGRVLPPQTIYQSSILW